MPSKFSEFRKNLKLERKAENVEDILKNCQNTGILNLICKELTEIPESVWKINTELIQSLPQNEKVIDFANEDKEELKWWDIKPIKKLNLSSNAIKSIKGDLKLISSLESFDIRDNLICEIPENISDLENLLSFSIANNSIEKLPNNIANLENLVILNIANNQIDFLDDDVFFKMRKLQQLSLSHNKIRNFPKNLPNSLRKICADNNEIATINQEILQSLTNLETLDLAYNKLTFLGTDFEPKQSRLTFLNLHHNKFTSLSNISCFTSLKECILAYNSIEDYDLKLMKLDNLEIIDFSHNKIKIIKDNIHEFCPSLITLKLAHNDINKIPVNLVELKRLSNFTITGNPIRNIPNNVIEEGYFEIKRLLERRVCDSNGDNKISPTSNKSPMCDSDKKVELNLPGVSSSGVLDWSIKREARINKWANAESKEIPLPDCEDWSSLIYDSLSPKNNVIEVNLSNRELPLLPLGVFSFFRNLSTLVLINCKLKSLPDDFDRFESLSHLDLSRNLLQVINPSLSRLKKLISLKLEANKELGERIEADTWTIQPFLQEPACKSLEFLSLKMCKLKSVPTVKLLLPDNMPRLNFLDLSDNDITLVPDELGQCQQLNYLGLEGNLFRVPRPSLLQMGSKAVLEYLKSRCS